MVGPRGAISAGFKNRLPKRNNFNNNDSNNNNNNNNIISNSNERNSNANHRRLFTRFSEHVFRLIVAAVAAAAADVVVVAVVVAVVAVVAVVDAVVFLSDSSATFVDSATLQWRWPPKTSYLVFFT